MDILRSRALWFSIAAAASFAAVAFAPSAEPGSFAPGPAAVRAASAPNPLWAAPRQTAALASVKGTAKVGTPAGGGPSANIGQTLTLKGPGLAPGTASFSAYNGGPVDVRLTNVKTGKKGKALVPPTSVTGEMAILPDGGEPSNGIRIQIVPTITTLSATQVSAGATITIDGTGFAPDARVVFPGVAEAVTPSSLDHDSVEVVVPAGVQKGKLAIRTSGGASNTKKIKVAAGALANRALATDPATGRILAVDDVENLLSEIDPATGAVLRTHPMPGEASWVAVARGTRVAIAGDDEGATFWFDLEAWAPLQMPSGFNGKQYSVGDGEVPVDRFLGQVLYGDERIQLFAPVEAARVAAGGSRVVALAGDAGEILVFDPADPSSVRGHAFGGPLEGLTIGLDGRAYTTDRASGRLLSVEIE